MSKSKKGQKLRKDFSAGNDSISKYKTITTEKFVPGRPGEEYFEITTSDGKKTQLSQDQKREFDKLKKK
jgi:hypothetical protein